MVARANAVEDGKLTVPVLNSARSRPSSDIDLLFAPKRKSQTGETGDIFKKFDAAAVKQSVKNIVMTNIGEKPFNPRFGGNVTGLLFENSDPTLKKDLEAHIVSCLETYEPRAENINVEIDDTAIDNNYLNVRVEFAIVNSLETVSIQTTIARLR